MSHWRCPSDQPTVSAPGGFAKARQVDAVASSVEDAVASALPLDLHKAPSRGAKEIRACRIAGSSPEDSPPASRVPPRHRSRGCR
jgi:hypothetical protein